MKSLTAAVVAAAVIVGLAGQPSLAASPSPTSDPTPTFEPCGNACSIPSPEPTLRPEPSVQPTVSLRLETEGCSSSLIVDYSNFGPTDFLVGYVQVDSQRSGFYVAGPGAGSVTVASSLSGAITADVAVDPFTADAALLDSFSMIPPGYVSEWFSTPRTWPIACATPEPSAQPTEPSAAPRATPPTTSTES